PAEGAPDLPAHSIPLLLPSGLSGLQRRSQIDVKFARYKWCLRQAQARDAIYSLRRHLRVQASLFNWKSCFSKGQASNTRSNDTISRIRAKVADSALSYRTARIAIAALGHTLKELGWAKAFPILHDEDIRQMTVGLEGESEGKRTLSWIWTSAGVGGDKDSADGAQDELCIQWCMVRARAFWWSEEVFLLLEEMTCVRSYHTWHAGWWEEQSVSREGLTAEENEGFAAYAFRQSSVRLAMRDTCAAAWQDVERYVLLGAQMADEEVHQGDSERDDEMYED
ncbi:hypothetical protein HWV62_5596, partial [Athelia sp. TMB]